MQLFITNFEKINNEIIINEKRILHQLKNVLRANKWYEFLIQQELQFNENLSLNRFFVKLNDISDKQLIAEIISTENIKLSSKKIWIIISIPNKFEKIELIVQKLTELWIPEIIFRPSNRSIIKDISDPKLQRLHKIILESVEQSKWVFLPTFLSIKNNELIKTIWDWKIVVFDRWWEKNSNIENNTWVYGLIGPEGWFEEKELNEIKKFIIKKIDISSNILRTETAAIIWWRILKNN